MRVWARCVHILFGSLMHPRRVYDGYMTKHISLRVPDELLARLQAAAGRDRRSLNSEVLWLLERGLDQDEAGE